MIIDLIVLLVVLPFFLVAVSLIYVNDMRLIGRIVAAFSIFQLAVITWLAWPLLSGQISVIEVSRSFDLACTRFDAAFILLTALVAACALTHGSVYYEQVLAEKKPPSSTTVKINYACVMFFVLAMYIVYLCKNLGYLWIGVESTTLLTAPLVYFNQTKHSLEATWKYLIICSVGISFALLGTLFIFASGQHGAISGGTLRLDLLLAVAPKLDFKLLRFGFIFCLLGYGTKAGMFPLHSWLPDAHSEAPAPSSALLSGALLNCALFAVWRVSEIIVASEHAQLSSETTLWVGTATVVAASLFLIRQYALKRLFAYSSIENVGVMLVAIGLNSGGLFFLQALNHSVVKVALFLLSGNVVLGTGKTNIGQQTGLMASAPAWAVLMAVGAFAVTGAPPFGTFLSEWLILMRTVELHYYINAALLVVGFALSFIVVCMHVGKVVLGAPNSGLHYFRPFASSLIPTLLVMGSLFLGLTTGSSVWTKL
jgi:hydrogenase-4 component F